MWLFPGRMLCFYLPSSLSASFLPSSLSALFKCRFSSSNVQVEAFFQARACVISSSETYRSDVQSGSLESSLLRLVNDHQNAAIQLREQTEKSKKEAMKSASRVSDLLVEAVNGGVEECFVNEKRIEVEIRAFKTTIKRFAKQTDQWLASTHAINNAIKEIGDFENWMKTMELDCKSITAAISNIHQS